MSELYPSSKNEYEMDFKGRDRIVSKNFSSSIGAPNTGSNTIIRNKPTYKTIDKRDVVTGDVKRVMADMNGSGQQVTQAFRLPKLSGQPKRRDTNADREVAPGVRTQRPKKQRRQQHPLVYIVVGGVAVLAVWAIGLNICVAYANGIGYPSYYTQTAHLDQISFKSEKGVPYQAHAFIDDQNRINVTLIPNGNTSKAQTLVDTLPLGKDIPSSPHITITKQQDGHITVTASGPCAIQGIVPWTNTDTFHLDIK